MKPHLPEVPDVPLYRWRPPDWAALAAPLLVIAAVLRVAAPGGSGAAAGAWVGLLGFTALWYAVLPRRPTTVVAGQLLCRGVRRRRWDLAALEEVLVARTEGGAVELGFGPPDRRLWVPVAGVRRTGRGWSAPEAGLRALAAGLANSPHRPAQVAADLLAEQASHVGHGGSIVDSPLLLAAGPAPRRRPFGLARG